MVRRPLKAAKASQAASDISIVGFLLLHRCLSEGLAMLRSCAPRLVSSPGQRLEDVLGKIATRYAAALKLRLGQLGQLFVFSGCRIAGATGP